MTRHPSFHMPFCAKARKDEKDLHFFIKVLQNAGWILSTHTVFFVHFASHCPPKCWLDSLPHTLCFLFTFHHTASMPKCCLMKVGGHCHPTKHGPAGPTQSSVLCFKHSHDGHCGCARSATQTLAWPNLAPEGPIFAWKSHFLESQSFWQETKQV